MSTHLFADIAGDIIRLSRRARRACAKFYTTHHSRALSTNAANCTPNNEDAHSHICTVALCANLYACIR